MGIVNVAQTVSSVTPLSIDGLWFRELSVIPTHGGPVMHMLREDNPWFERFGEIYFSEVLPGAVKAWKRHRCQKQNFAVPCGQLAFVIYDDRANSPSAGLMERLVLGRPDAYKLLHIPAMVWYGFSCVSATPAILANCADIPHSPDEADKIPANSSRIPYEWQ